MIAAGYDLDVFHTTNPFTGKIIHRTYPVPVSFGAVTGEFVAHGIYVDYDDNGGHHHERVPVVGVLVEHTVNRAGEVVDALTHFAVKGDACPGDYTIVTATHRFESTTNGALIGVYVAGEEPDAEDVEIANARAKTNQEAHRLRWAERQVRGA